MSGYRQHSQDEVLRLEIDHRAPLRGLHRPPSWIKILRCPRTSTSPHTRHHLTPINWYPLAPRFDNALVCRQHDPAHKYPFITLPNLSMPEFQLALPGGCLHQVWPLPLWQDLIPRHLSTTHLMISTQESNPSDGPAYTDLLRSQLWKHLPLPHRQDPGQSLGEVGVVTLQAGSEISSLSPTSRTC